MNNIVLIKAYEEPPFCQNDILRYAGCKTADSNVLSLLNECIEEAKKKLCYKVCYCQSEVTVEGDICAFDTFKLKSKSLAANLKDCERVVIFAATVGIEMDRLIAKYSKISPAKALMLQAIGAERIEALCNAFCKDLAKENRMGQRPRFSPGYGDLPLEAQREIFDILDCNRRLGVFLNNSLLMSPSKSVTAFVGLTTKEKTAH